MAISRAKKEALVEKYIGQLNESEGIIIADYRGLSVSELQHLRGKIREAEGSFAVVKNTLARRALENTDFACMGDSLTGPLLLAFSQEDPGAAARVISDFAKGNDKLVVKLVSIGGKLLAAGDIKRLADMPTKDQAISMLMSVMNAPVTKLARTMKEVPGKLVRTVAAVRDQKQAG